MMTRFSSFIGIDYSGAATPLTRSATIQVYECGVGSDPVLVPSPAADSNRRRNWNRLEVSDWLVDRLSVGDRCVVGVDHGFSFPIDYFKRYQLNSWSEFLDDFVKHWPTHESDATVEQFRGDATRVGAASELRLAEQWTSSAKSVFRFDVQGSVAKSTHAGLPLLKKVRDQVADLHCWPFDGWEFPVGQSVIAETYPSLFHNRYLRDARTTDQQDAYSICCWLRDMESLGRLDDFSAPPLTELQREVASLEGWILGVF